MVLRSTLMLFIRIVVLIKCEFFKIQKNFWIFYNLIRVVAWAKSLGGGAYSHLRLAPGRDLYQPNLGPHRCLEPGGRLGAGRVNWSNGPTKLVHFITKLIFLMLDPFGYSPLQLAPGRDLYQTNLGPHRCLEPGGRPGAGRLSGSNGPTKLAHFIIKRIFLMLDPFGYSPLRLAPGRDLYQPNLGPHRCLEPGGRPGAGRLSGSNGPTKLVHFITKRIFLMLNPFGYSPLRLAPGRDLYQPNLGPHRCLEPGGRLGAGRVNWSNGPTKLVNFITKLIFLMLDPFGYSPLRLKCLSENVSHRRADRMSSSND